MAKRLAGRFGYPKEDPFKVTLHADKIEEPLKWRKPSRIFVCSMGDLFHKDVEPIWLSMIFRTIEKCPKHTFMLLTKRPEIALEHSKNLMLEYFFGLPNLWLGVTVENQAQADERIPILLQIRAAVRFVSVEPMLGPVKLPSGWKGARRMSDGHEYYWQLPFLDWVICGGETGPGARPIHPDWARSLRDQCQAAGVPFFFKQWGEYCAISQMPPETYRAWDVQHGTENCWKEDEPCWRLGKKAAGRLLDGQEWNEFPTDERGRLFVAKKKVQ